MSLAPAEAKCQRVVFAAILWHFGAVSAVRKNYQDNKMDTVSEIWTFLGSYLEKCVKDLEKSKSVSFMEYNNSLIVKPLYVHLCVAIVCDLGVLLAK